ncbi:MAG TPA: GNAT family N-acetyltransferase [Micromonosporaceae bacterium]|nr:GNAT family N-acetyltransferase [Micromonosporaceae bacterium]
MSSTHPTVEHLNPSAVLDELREVYVRVFAEPPYNESPDMADEFIEWLSSEPATPGFDLVVARDAGRLVGFACGHTMPAGRWWRSAEQPPPAHIAATDTFAVREWAVLGAHRRRGIGRRLMAELLAGRPEPWATLVVNLDADAWAIYQRWGWVRVGLSRPPRRPSMDVMVLDLRAGRLVRFAP